MFIYLGCDYRLCTQEEKLNIIDYFERNYRQLLLSAVMMIKDVDKAQDILHNVAVALLKRQNELSDLEHPGAYIAQCIYRVQNQLFQRLVAHPVGRTGFILLVRGADVVDILFIAGGNGFAHHACAALAAEHHAAEKLHCAVAGAAAGIQ